MDLLTFIGFALGLSLLGFGASEAGSLKVFLNAHGLAIVVGGTVAMTLVNSSGKSLWSCFRAFVLVFFPKNMTPVAKVIATLRQCAERTKTEGIVALQDTDKRMIDGFLSRAANVAIMSGDAEFTRSVLDEDVLQMRLRHSAAQNVFRTAGVMSPMIGLLGTLIGIVNVLQQISDPAKVGPAMATALSTAFYGILIAAFFAVPVAGKLRERSNDEALLKQLVIEGIIGILKNEPPYLLELRLRSFARTKGVPAGMPTPMTRKVA
jgi:chemotaxis protein MotA